VDFITDIGVFAVAYNDCQRRCFENSGKVLDDAPAFVREPLFSEHL
jgi:hypothetical protein